MLVLLALYYTGLLPFVPLRESCLEVHAQSLSPVSNLPVFPDIMLMFSLETDLVPFGFFVIVFVFVFALFFCFLEMAGSIQPLAQNLK